MALPWLVCFMVLVPLRSAGGGGWYVFGPPWKGKKLLRLAKRRANLLFNRFLGICIRRAKDNFKDRAFTASTVGFMFSWLRVILKYKEPVHCESIRRWRSWWETVLPVGERQQKRKGTWGKPCLSSRASCESFASLYQQPQAFAPVPQASRQLDFTMLVLYSLCKFKLIQVGKF